jgi:hypothetical protein
MILLIMIVMSSDAFKGALFPQVVLIHYLAGFAGALASALFVHGRVSVGASGATMGLIGARLAEVLMNWDASSPHHRTPSIVSTSLFSFLLCMVCYPSWTTSCILVDSSPALCLVMCC